MTPEVLAYIILALEKGIPMAIDVYGKVVDSIAAHKDMDADTKTELLARIAKAYLPERHFIMEGSGA